MSLSRSPSCSSHLAHSDAVCNTVHCPQSEQDAAATDAAGWTSSTTPRRRPPPPPPPSVRLDLHHHRRRRQDRSESAPKPAETAKPAQRRRRTSNRRRVAFKPTVHFREIPSRENFSSQDIQELWFSEKDVDMNRAESRSTVKKMRKLLKMHGRTATTCISSTNDSTTKPPPIQALLTSFDTDDMSVRGLEHLRSRCVLVELQQHKRQVTDAILCAQDQGDGDGHGRHRNRRDDIAAISQKISAEARMRAIQVGRQDAIDAWRGEQDVPGALGVKFNDHLSRILDGCLERS
mmetsp:Transcript_22653/g.65219  ORF Transcript_22653/g.65219 Transcript_22653/m.65219 type:complete len:291 (+) Transcript_22653:290-1162(+)